MRVLVIGDFLKASGMTRYIFNVIGKIDDPQIKIDVLAISGSDECRQMAEAQGWHFYKVLPANGHLLKHSIQMRRFFKQNADRYDVIHFHETALWNFFPIICAHHFGAKHIVLNSHNTYFASNGSRLVLKVLEVLHAIGKRVVGRVVDKNIAVSQEAAKWMFPSKVIKHNDYLIVPNAIKLSDFDFDEKVRTRIRLKLGVFETQRLYGNIGVLNKRKNQLRLIDIFKKITTKDSKARLILIGDGPSRDEVLKRINTLKLNESVSLLGQLDDVKEYYQALDAIIMPSINEGLSTVLLEAQVSGLNIFPSAEVPLGDYLKDIVTPISLSANDSTWAKTILSHTNSDMRQSHLKEMKSRGFDVVTAAQRTQQVYLEEITDE